MRRKRIPLRKGSKYKMGEIVVKLALQKRCKHPEPEWELYGNLFQHGRKCKLCGKVELIKSDCNEESLGQYFNV